jgi:hypothetical protein
MSAEEQDICGAVGKLNPDFIDIEQKILGLDWSEATVTCIKEPHDPEERHWGLLVLDGGEKGEVFWEDSPPEPAD